MALVFDDLYQFSSYVPPIDLSFHQYLLLSDEPVLVHTGSMDQAHALVPQLKEVLGARTLKYIFVSHFESDECGGLSVLLKEFPDAKTLCSVVTARQLKGFGITTQLQVSKPGEKLIAGGQELLFVGYPAEMHLWEGLLLMENKRGIFFCSDLVFGMGKTDGQIVTRNWQSQIENITLEQIPSPELKAKLQENLQELRPNFVAVGHGPCVKVSG